MKTISICLPLYYEEGNVLPLAEEFETLRQQLGNSYKLEVIWVNDGSEDKTANEILEVIKKYGSYNKFINLRRRFGQSAAFQAGLDYAMGDYIVTMDADRQNDPADIIKMLELLEKDPSLDMVVGWRKDRKDKSFLKLSSRIGNFFFAKLFNTRVKDRGCALRVYRRDLAKEIKLHGELHRFITEIATMAGAKVAEIPVNHRARTNGKSKYNILKTFQVLIQVTYLFFIYKWWKTPMYYFGILSFMLMGLGVLCEILVILLKFTIGLDITGDPLLYVGILMIMTGFQLLSIGVIADLVVRSSYVHEKPYKIRETVGFDNVLKNL